MRALTLPALVVGGLMLSAAPASAQPDLYVCTPSAQVLLVNGTSGATSVLYTGTGSFYDCVLGPDGRLYIANGTSILRINTNGTGAETVNASSPLASAARDLAFNVTTLYVNTASTGVYKLEGTPPATDGAPLDFSAPALAFALTSSGQGIVFDRKGKLNLASGTQIRQSAPPYAVSAALIQSTQQSGIQPVGIAVNTCGELVFADAASQSVRRHTPNAPGNQPKHAAVSGLQFTGKDIPLFIEIASNNDMFIVTAEDLSGTNGKVWYADFSFGTSPGACSTATKTPLVELKGKTTGPDAIPSLAAQSAIGVALAATNHDLTLEFGSGADQLCSQDYHFGYHRMRLEFTDCQAAFSGGQTAKIKVQALKSTLSQVSFSPALFAASTEGIRYSGMNGFITQYQYNLADDSPSDPFPTPIRLIFFFNTQEPIAKPGVARGGDGISTQYDENVGDEYWAVQTADDPAGARGDDISKRVVFNTGLAEQCRIVFEPPFRDGNPLYKVGQSATIALNATNIQTGQPCSGAELRISIVKNAGTSFDAMEVKSKGSETANIMSQSGAGKYIYHADLSGYPTGTYDLTVWGTITAPIPKGFTIKK
jgi:hypothetical protein